jgi:hypothetical protein
VRVQSARENKNNPVMVTFVEALAEAKRRRGIPANTFVTAPRGGTLYKLSIQIMREGGSPTRRSPSKSRRANSPRRANSRRRHRGSL